VPPLQSAGEHTNAWAPVTLLSGKPGALQGPLTAGATAAACTRAGRSGGKGAPAPEAAPPAAPRAAPPAGAAELDPVLAHLLRNARSEAVRHEFRAAPGASYTERHEVTLLARAPQ
jgi:hypothetical protein